MGTITVRVIPRSPRPGLGAGGPDDVLLRVHAPAERGRATDEARRLLANVLGVSVTRVSLRRGARSRTKVFEVAGLTDEQIALRVGATKGH